MSGLEPFIPMAVALLANLAPAAIELGANFLGDKIKGYTTEEAVSHRIAELSGRRGLNYGANIPQLPSGFASQTGNLLDAEYRRLLQQRDGDSISISSGFAPQSSSHLMSQFQVAQQNQYIKQLERKTQKHSIKEILAKQDAKRQKLSSGGGGAGAGGKELPSNFYGKY